MKIKKTIDPYTFIIRAVSETEAEAEVKPDIYKIIVELLSELQNTTHNLASVDDNTPIKKHIRLKAIKEDKEKNIIYGYCSSGESGEKKLVESAIQDLNPPAPKPDEKTIEPHEYVGDAFCFSISCPKNLDEYGLMLLQRNSNVGIKVILRDYISNNLKEKYNLKFIVKEYVDEDYITKILKNNTPKQLLVNTHKDLNIDDKIENQGPNKKKQPLREQIVKTKHSISNPSIIFRIIKAVKNSQNKQETSKAELKNLSLYLEDTTTDEMIVVLETNDGDKKYNLITGEPSFKCYIDITNEVRYTKDKTIDVNSVYSILAIHSQRIGKKLALND